MANNKVINSTAINSKNMKKLLYGVIITFTVIASVFVSLTTLGINYSVSFPYKYFLILKGNTFNKGQLVQIIGHDTAYTQDAKFIKQVRGVAGDVITIKRNNIFINSNYIGRLNYTTKDGATLTPVTAGVIPSGYVFVWAPHNRSFDSRYKEFGLIKTANISGRVLAKFGRV